MDTIDSIYILLAIVFSAFILYQESHYKVKEEEQVEITQFRKAVGEAKTVSGVYLKLTLTTHSGTHLDAPWHYWPTSEGKPSKTIDQIPRPFRFKVTVFPVKIERASAGWVRAVAILEE
jgi:kynurenine formamidase